MRTIKVNVPFRTAQAMVCHFITLSKRTIKSKREFDDELKSYIGLYGFSCEDDHLSEISEEDAEVAKETTEKYY